MVEWIEYGKTWKQFRLDELNKPGTQIEVAYIDSMLDDKEEYDTLLIGDINELAGVCDHCRNMFDEAIVKRYAVYEIEQYWHCPHCPARIFKDNQSLIDVHLRNHKKNEKATSSLLDGVI